MNEKSLELIAGRFRLLGDALRLRLLQTLEQGELSVADLVAATGAAQANVSKHLQLLWRGGLVQRRKQGMFVYYSITDRRVFELCDAVCGSLTEHLNRELSQLEQSTSGRARAAKPARAPRRG